MMSVPGTERTIPLIEQLDFLYLPSADAARDLAFYRDVLGGEIVFAIEAFGTRVARVRLGAGPALLLAEHLDGEQPVLVHRVEDLEAARATLRERGLDAGEPFGIPHGPCIELQAPGGQRLALYELTRPEAEERLAGRYDFEPEG
jgi:catechol 2,3-dioxygenase-like lactoylglutathione lyase family enzyme